MCVACEQMVCRFKTKYVEGAGGGVTHSPRDVSPVEDSAGLLLQMQVALKVRVFVSLFKFPAHCIEHVECVLDVDVDVRTDCGYFAPDEAVGTALRMDPTLHE